METPDRSFGVPTLSEEAWCLVFYAHYYWTDSIFLILLMKKLGSERTICAMTHVSTYQSWNSNPSLTLKLIVFLQYFARSENDEGGYNVRNVHELYF